MLLDKAARLSATARALWEAAVRQFAPSELERVRVFLECAAVGRPSQAGDPRRELHPRLWFPGLTARPWWDADAFPLAHRLQRRHELIVDEAHRLLATSGVFAAHPGRSGVGAAGDPDSPLEGRWLGYYLQRHMRRVRETAAHVPITLRSLDGVPCAREALLSFLGPRSRINRHSDKVNFVVTMYLPLFASGASIAFGGESRAWVDGRCATADSTFYHESRNDSDRWRGLLLVDMWHPELTPVERSVLAGAVPRINDILRDGRDD